MTSTAASDPVQPAEPGRNAAGSVTFRERLLPAPWLWMAGVLLAVLSTLVVVPFGPAVAVTTALVMLVVVLGLLVAWSPVIAVIDGELVAGRAHVPVSLLGDVTDLDAAAMRAEVGPRLDVRSFLCIRGWVPTGVRADLLDPDDPTPYWIVSTRRPAELVAAIESARTRG